MLRPVNVLGYYVHSMIGQYLRERRVPTVLGFDPMMQFIHEEDVSEAIALALEHGLQGVFNVTGPGAGAAAHRDPRDRRHARSPMPELADAPALRAAASASGMLPYPAGAIDYLKYPVTVSGSRFVEATHFRPLFGLEEIFHSVRR